MYTLKDVDDVTNWSEEMCCDWLDDNHIDDDGGDPRIAVKLAMLQKMS